MKPRLKHLWIFVTAFFVFPTSFAFAGTDLVAQNSQECAAIINLNERTEKSGPASSHPYDPNLMSSLIESEIVFSQFFSRVTALIKLTPRELRQARPEEYKIYASAIYDLMEAILNKDDYWVVPGRQYERFSPKFGAMWSRIKTSSESLLQDLANYQYTYEVFRKTPKKVLVEKIEEILVLNRASDQDRSFMGLEDISEIPSSETSVSYGVGVAGILGVVFSGYGTLAGLFVDPFFLNTLPWAAGAFVSYAALLGSAAEDDKSKPKELSLKKVDDLYKLAAEKKLIALPPMAQPSPKLRSQSKPGAGANPNPGALIRENKVIHGKTRNLLWNGSSFMPLASSTRFLTLTEEEEKLSSDLVHVYTKEFMVWMAFHELKEKFVHDALKRLRRGQSITNEQGEEINAMIAILLQAIEATNEVRFSSNNLVSIFDRVKQNLDRHFPPNRSLEPSDERTVKHVIDHVATHLVANRQFNESLNMTHKILIDTLSVLRKVLVAQSLSEIQALTKSLETGTGRVIEDPSNFVKAQRKALNSQLKTMQKTGLLPAK